MTPPTNPNDPERVDSKKLFRASQIAAALDRPRQMIARQLAETAGTGTVVVNGQPAPAWSLAELPSELRAQLETVRARGGYRSIEDLLTEPPKRWEPPIPLPQVAPKCLDQAVKLQKALAPSLGRMNDMSLAAAEFERLGVEDFRRQFGYAVSPRHWRAVLKRTLERDGGAEDWARLEIYLPDRLVSNAPVPAPLGAGGPEFIELRQQILRLPANPSPDQCVALWQKACLKLNDMISGGKRLKVAKRQLLSFLAVQAPFLAQSPAGLHAAFNRRYKASDGGRNIDGLFDGRRERKGRPTVPPFPQPDVDMIESYALCACGGRISQAVREIGQMDRDFGFATQTVVALRPDSSSKSYVNHRLREAMRYSLKTGLAFLIGGQKIDDITAAIERDYQKLASMQIVCMDDFTMPVYACVPDGAGWFTMTRGQCLLAVDVRSWCIIGHSLQPERSYDSFVIRTLMNRVCRELGIPGVWHHERGIWAKAALVRGPKPPPGWEEAHSADEVSVGWERLGVRFMNSIRARSKPAERAGGLLQDLMEGEKGYCGRDERIDCPEETRRNLDAVAARRMHPADYFYTFEQWDERLAELISKYNAARQDGDVLQGTSPNEAFEAHWTDDKLPTRLDASSWHLCAHYVQKMVVGRDGISFRFGKHKFKYFDGQTSPDRCREVLAWFDPEFPDYIGVTDLNGRNPYIVERSKKVDYDAAPDDPVYKHEMEKAALHNSYPKARFHTLKATFQATFRKNLVDKHTAAVAERFQTERDTRQAARGERQAAYDQARNMAQKLGVPASILNPDSAEAKRGLEKFAQALRDGRKENETQGPTEVKQ